MGVESRLKRKVEAPASAPVAPQPEAKPAPKKESQLMQVKEVGGRRWWLVGLGSLLVLAGFGGFMVFASNPTAMTIGVISIFAILGGGICIWMGVQKRESGIVLTKAGSTKPGEKTAIIQANSVNIYPDHIAFEQLPEDQLEGQPRKCHNDNKYYYMHIWDTAWRNPHPLGKLIQFLLPDTQYRDPRYFSLNLRIPAHRKLAQRKASLMEKLSPALLLVAMIIIGIIWVATTPTPVPGG